MLKNGNVGIGTTTPATKLSVLSGANGEVGPIVTASAPVFSLGREGTGGTKWPLNATFDLGTYATGVHSQTQLDIKVSNGPVATPDVTVMSLLGNGNVGIGTTTPSSPLEVVTGANYIRATTNDGNGSGNGFGYAFRIANINEDIARINGVYESSFFNGFGGMSFTTRQTGGTLIERMRINSAGNVGIGTTTPGAKLDVAGNARIQSLPAGAGTDDVVVADANGLLKKVSASTIGNDGDAWGVTGEDTTSAIGRTGNVGIGNTTPKATLDVTGTPTTVTTADGIIAPRLTGDQLAAKTAYGADQTAAQVYVTAAATTPAGATVNVTAPGYYYFDGTVWQKVSTGKLKFVDGTTATDAVYTAGNVGIGTTTPAAKLDVNISRPNIHAKSKTSSLKSSKNYQKKYRGQGR